MNINFVTYDKDNPEHLIAAEELQVWSSESGTMRTLYPQWMAEYPYGVLGYSELTGALAGHIAVTDYDPTRALATIGGYVVNPQFRKHGIGKSLVAYLVATAKDTLPDSARCVARANRFSLSQFEAVGGHIVRLNDELAPNACGRYIVDLTAAVADGGDIS